MGSYNFPETKVFKSKLEIPCELFTPKVENHAMMELSVKSCRKEVCSGTVFGNEDK